MAVDYTTIGDAIRALCSQAITDGMVMQRTQKQVDNGPLNERAQGLLSLIVGEVEAELALANENNA